MSEKPIILIIDDDDNILQSLRRALLKEPYEIRTANNGIDALEIAQETDIAAIICDYSIPGMSGVEILTKAKNIRPDAIQIMLTGHTDFRTAQSVINDAHVEFLLLKPWDNDQLKSIASHAVDRFKLNRTHEQLRRETEEHRRQVEKLNQTLQEEVEKQTKDLRMQNAELRILQQRVRSSLTDTVKVLVQMMEELHPNTALHSKRVAQMSRRLGDAMGMPPEAIDHLEVAARLHDIGNAIQHRRNQTTKNISTRLPQTQMPPHLHSELAYTMLRHIRGFDEVCLAVRHQCEHFDGTGLPEHRKGQEVPLASRIIAIANAYDTAVHGASGRTKVNRDIGRSTLTDGAGTLFDPQLVQTFLSSLEALGVEDSSDNEVELSPRDIEAEMTLSRSIYNHDGVLILRANTKLSIDHVAHIQKLSARDPLLGGIYVKCDQEVNKPDNQTPPTKRTTAPKPGKNRRGHVLIVDDDTLVSNALVRELRRSGWETTCAADGRAAQNILEENTFDVLIVDVAMPVMRGDMLVAHVGQCRPECPCVVLTGHATRDQIMRISASDNVVAILAKPWNSQRLLAALDKATTEWKPQNTDNDTEAVLQHENPV